MNTSTTLRLTAADLLNKHPVIQDVDFGKAVPGEIYKFIKVNDEYRFCLAIFGHGELLNADETADSGGTFRLAHSHWTMTDWQSSSLRVRCGVREIEELTAILGRIEDKRW